MRPILPAAASIASAQSRISGIRLGLSAVPMEAASRSTASLVSSISTYGAAVSPIVVAWVAVF